MLRPKAEVITDIEVQGIELRIPKSPTAAYAAALSMAHQRGTLYMEPQPDPSAAPVKDYRRKPEVDPVAYPFPTLSVVRTFDRSRATAEWRRFESELAVNCRRAGASALLLSEMEVVLISSDQFQSAQTERYRFAASHKTSKLRTEASRDVSKAAKEHIIAATSTHEQAYRRYLCGESNFQFKDEEECFESQLLISESEAEAYGRKSPIVKADVLWQKHEPRIELTPVMTGQHSIGTVLDDDSLGVFRTESETIAKALCADRDIDFKPAHFRLPRHKEWTMTFATGVFTSPTDKNQIRIPAHPIDIPLNPPTIRYEEF